MKFTRNAALTLLAAGMMCAMPACKKGDSDSSPVETAVQEVQGPPASVRFINGGSTAGVDLVVDGAAVASGVAAGAFERNRLSVASGSHTAELRAGGSSVAQFSFALAPSASYTVVVAGSGSSLDVIRLNDDLGHNNGGNVRFVSAMPGTSVNVNSASGSTLAGGLNYQAATDFLTLPSGTNRIVVESGGTTIFDGPLTTHEARATTVVIVPDGRGARTIEVLERLQ